MKSTFTFMFALLLVQLTAIGSPKTFTADFGQIRSNLYLVPANNIPVLMDGNLTQYDNDYSNDLDGMDARKMSNFSENWGLLRANTVLIIERRNTIRGNDSIFFKMWNLRVNTYQLEFVASNLDRNGATGVLEDTYLHTTSTISLNGTTLIKFSVTDDPESRASDRFRVLFSTVTYSPLPLTFVKVKATPENNRIYIDWKTANETNVSRYQVERSTDAINFSKVAEVTANNLASNTYHWTDEHPAGSNNYYRIHSVDLDGKTSYSEVMHVAAAKSSQSISIFPNPAIGNNLNLQITNGESGAYDIRLLNSFGQPLLIRSLQYSGGTSTWNLKPGSIIPKGIYQLEIKTPGGDRKLISVLF